MKYKIEKHTLLFKTLSVVKSDIKKANKAAFDLADKITGKKNVRIVINTNALAGGISGIELKEKPDGWVSVGDKYLGLYKPGSR